MPRRRRRKVRRRSTLAPKYFARRVTLVTLPVVAVIVAVLWFLLSSLSQAEEPEAAAPPAEPEVSALPPEPSGSEPEPEPEPEPVRATDWRLLLVNANNPLPEGYADGIELETITEPYMVDKRIATDLRRMFTAAKQDGINLKLCSAYRSVEKQEELFQNQIQGHRNEGLDEEEATAAALTLVARPGYSEHHTGLAVDIVTPTYEVLDEGFAETAAFGWLDQHAAEYGFILRYPKNKEGVTGIDYEPWHYRYVGTEYAKAIKSSGECLEEFLWVTLKDQAAMIAEMERAIADEDLDEPDEEPDGGDE